MNWLIAEKVFQLLKPKASWKPSTNIMQAFEALEKTCNNYSILKDLDGNYYVSIFPDAPNQTTVVGETLPLAICRTVLSALGVKVTDY